MVVIIIIGIMNRIMIILIVIVAIFNNDNTSSPRLKGDSRSSYTCGVHVSRLGALVSRLVQKHMSLCKASDSHKSEDLQIIYRERNVDVCLYNRII